MSADKSRGGEAGPLTYNALNPLQSEGPLPQDLIDAIDEHRRAVNGLINGDIELFIDHCSKHGDVTVAGGWGGFERGWDEASRRFRWASSNFAGDGQNKCFFENVAVVVSGDLATSLDIERNEVVIKGTTQLKKMGLRVTTVFRRENGKWKMTHRHGDPFVDEQKLGAVIRE